MTPEFAKMIDPIFLEVFELMDRIDRGEHVDFEAAHRSLAQQLHEVTIAGQAAMFQAYDWNDAVYAITCWVDEILASGCEWDGAQWWMDHPLEKDERLFRTRGGNSIFYEKAAESRSEDAMESFYVSAMLGFRGLYSTDNDVNRRLRQELHLAETQELWVDDLRQRIHRLRQSEQAGAASAELYEITVATPLRSWPFVILPWVFVPILLGLMLVFGRL